MSNDANPNLLVNIIIFLGGFFGFFIGSIIGFLIFLYIGLFIFSTKGAVILGSIGGLLGMVVGPKIVSSLLDRIF
jgi:hypothetical protein